MSTVEEDVAEFLWQHWQDPDGLPAVRILEDPRKIAEGLSRAGLLASSSRKVEWGLRYRNLQNEPVYVSTGNNREDAERIMAPGDVLVYREVTEWRTNDG